MTSGPAVLTAVATWGARLAWLATALVGGAAVGDAVATRSPPVQDVATIGAWAGWSVGAVALAVQGVATLTIARVIVPGALVVAAAAAISGADPASVLGLVLPAAVATVLTASAETGRAWIQASAYGGERRFPLRPPLGYLAAAVTTWGVWASATVAAPPAWAARAWLPAVPATAAVALGALTLPRRWHQLSRRWLVAVPAGVVVHDPVVLADPVLLTRAQVADVALAELGPGVAVGAADLTGPTPGLALELTLRETVTVVLAPTPAQPRGTAIDLSALLVSPTRPGAALAELRRRLVPT